MNRAGLKKMYADLALENGGDPPSAPPKALTPFKRWEAVRVMHDQAGFWNCHDQLPLEGHGWNPKPTYRVCCAMELSLPRSTKLDDVRQTAGKGSSLHRGATR